MFNILIPSLAYGGAERIAIEKAKALVEAGQRVTFFVLWKATAGYEVPIHPLLKYEPLFALDRTAKLRRVIDCLRKQAQPLLITHLIRIADLQSFWDAGIYTMPVIHNAPPGWQDAPAKYLRGMVPLIVGCCDTVARQVRSAGAPCPVIGVRHQTDVTNNPKDRDLLRKRLQIPSETLVIGMIGRFKTQKRYDRAISILASVQSLASARLVIIGGFDEASSSSKVAKLWFERALKEFKQENSVVVLGDRADASDWIACFDVLLNCSDYEGYSIACAEALAQSCPVVATNVGGQSEFKSPLLTLIETNSSPHVFAKSIIESKVKHRSEIQQFAQPVSQHIAATWSQVHAVARLCLNADRNSITFVINNLNVGGAQTSLLNLLSSAPMLRDCSVVTTKGASREAMKRLRAVGIHHQDIGDMRNPEGIAGKILMHMAARKSGTLVFWNLEARVKLWLSKLLHETNVAIVDVSPGSTYFEELFDSQEYAKNLGYPIRLYAQRLDHFVYKYSGGLDQRFTPLLKNNSMIPNGVTPQPIRRNLGINDDLLRIGVMSRIHPVKRISLVLDVADWLVNNNVNASVYLKGPISEAPGDYRRALERSLAARQLENFTFLRDGNNPKEFLQEIDVLLLIAEPGGCPKHFA